MIDALLTRFFRRALGAAMHLDPHLDGLPRPGPVRPMLYLHVPFCRSLCPFCSFHRVRHTGAKASRYFEALRQEVRHYHDLGFRFEEVYVGGGTPTTDPAQLAVTLDRLHALFPIRRISLETNPSELTPDVVQMLRDGGVDRVSVGVQSFDDRMLERMGRFAAYGSGASIIDRLAAVQGRFDTLNVDMMFNLPGQTEDSLRRDLGILTETLAVDQVSFYPLMAGPNARRAMQRTMGGGPADHERRFYAVILDHMLHRYAASSAWCFSREGGRIDEYIVDHPQYLGAGSGAFSYLDGVLYSNTFSVSGYARRIDAGLTGITASRHLSADERLHYEFLLGLFGIELKDAWMARTHGPDWASRLRPELPALRLCGAVRRTADGYRLSRRGMYAWVVMMREFFNGVNALRDQMRHRIREERSLLDRALADSARSA